MYFPQIGHASWSALRGEGSVLARGRTLMLLQDAWLKEIVETLKSLGRFERTVIAVTADHGIRTSAEDPALPIGRISDYMFRVPLIIYAPRTLQKTMKISSPTSHIDFAPTLLALLGATDAVARMQGVPLWRRSPPNRIYFLASTYGGADGFVEGGIYYMRQVLSGAVYRSPRFDFSDDRQARPGDPVIPFVTEALARLDALQQTLVSRSLDEPR
jgi:membrane-anchored protein YejM (alkaline phosphatase superfamily)